MKQIFVGGIGTEVGKTIVSAILTEALQADYWKPVQCGNLDNSDRNVVAQLVSNNKSQYHPESYRLKSPKSPHAAAIEEDIKINIEGLQIPVTDNHLIIEGVGGLLVPLNDEQLVIDLVEKWQWPVVLVSQNYLGSINHTLLSVEALQKRNIEIIGIVFNGKPNPETEQFILQHTGLQCLLRVGEEETISSEAIKKYATEVTNILSSELF